MKSKQEITYDVRTRILAGVLNSYAYGLDEWGSIHIGSESHPAYCLMGTVGRDADH